VGADGLILVRASTQADLAMIYFNADGSRAFCGNGTLCVARWAQQEAAFGASLRLATDSGVLPLQVMGSRVQVEVAAPTDWRQGISLAPAGLQGEGIHLDTGCPHLVVVCPQLPDAAEFAALARPLRHHPALAPAGANVDFISVEDPHRLRVRTFERGVEGETLASGTGCLAAALAAASLSLAASPVSCMVQGGTPLKVRFRRDADGVFSAVSLEGEARLVYRGVTGPDAATAP
jgi:diaminopimelate epimerase